MPAQQLSLSARPWWYRKGTNDLWGAPYWIREGDDVYCEPGPVEPGQLAVAFVFGRLQIKSLQETAYGITLTGANPPRPTTYHPRSVEVIGPATYVWERQTDRYREIVRPVPKPIDLIELPQTSRAVARFRCAPDLRFLTCDEHFTNVTQNEPEALFGYGWAETIHPSDVAKVMANSAAALAQPHTFVSDALARDRHGSFRRYVNIMIPVLHSGVLVGWEGTAQVIG